jgi:hypothetical protein
METKQMTVYLVTTHTCLVEVSDPHEFDNAQSNNVDEMPNR